MMILVTGYPRSGTKYMACLLQAYGYDVGHERFGKDGISSWMHAVDTPTVPHGDARAGRKYDVTIHVVRHPLRVIASMTTVSKVSLDFLARHASMNGKTFVARIARNWIAWNRMIEITEPDIRIRIEEAAEILPAFLAARVRLLELSGDLPPTNVNAREHPPLGWKRFAALVSRELAVQLADLAAEYGYDVRR